MTAEELKNMPKEVMIASAPNEIAMVWDKLPEKLKSDIDILKYQYCTDHYNDLGEDAADGPSPRRLFCCYCKVNDINIRSEKCVKIPGSTKRFSSLNCLVCCKKE
ncbi:MAG: hypothetical protein ACREAD_09135 [Nitrosopumilaceae archaeon]